MTAKFLAPHPWPRIEALARRSVGLVAVPFLGKDAAKLLPLKRGSTLVTRLAERDVVLGLVDPREVIKFLGRGVIVHRCDNLHAKVYVFGKTAVIGSSNASQTSNRMLEACVETTDATVVTEARRFIEDLKVDEVGKAFAKSLIPLYPADRIGGSVAGDDAKKRVNAGTAGSAQHSRMWIWPAEDSNYPNDVERADKRALPLAKLEMTNPSTLKLDSFFNEGNTRIDAKKGDRVVFRYGAGRSVEFEAPGRLIYVEPHPKGGLYYFETPKNQRRRNLEQVRAALGDAVAAVLYKGHSYRLVRRAATAAAVAKMWPAGSVRW
jgi:hypothetical protein